MMQIHCYTSVSFAYMQRARILAETVKRFHPDWTLWLCLSDREPPGFAFDLEAELFDRVIWAHDLPINNFDTWAFKHNVIEFCTAVKGFAAEKILENGADAVIYIDPDIALFSVLNEVIEAFQDHSIVLTPHLVDPEDDSSAIWENERSALLHGVYNLGFIGIKNDLEGRRFANWWKQRLALYCYEEASLGVYTDQRWCDLALAFFDRVKVLRNPGYNVASWNLSKRPIIAGKDGSIRVAEVQLKFFHFTKIDAVGKLMIERYFRESAIVFEIVEWYQSSMRRNELGAIPAKWWYYGSYSDGTLIAQSDRKRFRSTPELPKRFPRPFAAETYLAWLNTEEVR